MRSSRENPLDQQPVGEQAEERQVEEVAVPAYVTPEFVKAFSEEYGDLKWEATVSIDKWLKKRAGVFNVDSYEAETGETYGKPHGAQRIQGLLAGAAIYNQMPFLELTEVEIIDDDSQIGIAKEKIIILIRLDRLEKIELRVPWEQSRLMLRAAGLNYRWASARRHPSS